MNEINAAIYQRLDAQITTPIFDHVPEGEDSFPFIRLDAVETSGNDTDAESGFFGLVQVFAYSRYKGINEVAALNLEIYNALHRWAFPDTTSFGITSINQIFSNILTEGDGLTRLSVQRFNVTFEPLPTP